MTIIVRVPTVATWYESDFLFSMASIKTFILSTNLQIATTAMERRKQESKGRERHELFNEYFENLQIRSALTTLCSFFEHELNKLCDLYRSEKGFALKSDELRGKGVQNFLLYLEKIAGLNIHRSSRELNEIGNIQHIRNKIVHSGGQINDKCGIQYVGSKLEFFERDDEEGDIFIKTSFLLHVFETYGNYFKLISDSIKAKESLSS
jgi:hypothetical protein